MAARVGPEIVVTSAATDADAPKVSAGDKKKALKELERKQQEEDHRRKAAEAGFQLNKMELTELADNRESSYLAKLGGVEGLAIKLKANLREGLSEEQVKLSRDIFGENKMPNKRVKAYWEHLWDSVSDTTIIVLICCSILTIIFGTSVSKKQEDWIQGIAIMVAVVVVTTVTSVQNYTQDQQFVSLSKVKEDRLVKVKRGDHEVDISIYEVVVGDIFVMRSGEVLPCDGVFIRGNGVICNESAMTGESKQIHKTVSEPFLVGGANMDAGAGQMLVTTVGEDTSYGKIVKKLQEEEPPPTPLQEKLEYLAKQIGYIGLGFGGATFIVLLVSWSINKVDKSLWYSDILGYAIVSITIIVVAVPEGLPLAVTISLAFSMKRMIKDKNLVRDLNACETMGSATCICSDKTGTLTLNRMTVVKGLFFGKEFDIVPSVDSIGGEDQLTALAHAIAHNADANIDYSVDPPIFKDNKTECALLHMLHENFGVDFYKLRREAGEWVYRENFSSERKRMTTIYGPDSKDNYVIHCKGASEIVLGLCNFYQQANGEIVRMSDDFRITLNELITKMASSGLRTLCISSKSLAAGDNPAHEISQKFAADMKAAASETGGAGLIDTGERDKLYKHLVDDGAIEKDLVLLAIVGIKDPVRPEVPLAVLKCKQARIRVRMVTGDNIMTAMHIAEDCGILRPGGLCMEGRQFREMDHKARLEMLPRLDVMARSSPTDKNLLVNSLKELNEVVAVTGDGTNDAPALRAAHVGLAMGIAGTEVAKEASKIVIMDDNFASIVSAVKWGRSVLENIRKFLNFQLTINIVACGVTFIIAFTNNGDTEKFPLTPVQLLWINLIMDSFAALALATEPPSENLLKMKPQGRTEPLITKIIKKNLVGHAAFQTMFILVMTLYEHASDTYFATHESKTHLTCIFNTFVFLQLCNKMNCRKIHDQWDIFEGLFSAHLALLMIFIILVMQVIIIEAAGVIMRTVPLRWDQWLVCIGYGFLSFPVGIIMRCIPYRDIDTGYDPRTDTILTVDESTGSDVTSSGAHHAGETEAVKKTPEDTHTETVAVSSSTATDSVKVAAGTGESK